MKHTVGTATIWLQPHNELVFNQETLQAGHHAGSIILVGSIILAGL